MATVFTNEMIQTIIREYSDSDNKILAQRLGISQDTLRWKASQLGVRKSDQYMKIYYSNLQKNRKAKQEKNYKNYIMTNIERNILIGSLLGDGTLSKYGRSLNACYRENTGKLQIPYRRWKAEKLSNLDFKINSNGAIYSPSHPIYTELYEIFYPKGIKTIPKEGVKMLNHPIGLACLFMDDGSLTTSGNKGRNTIIITANIPLYTQNFSKDENLLLLRHIKEMFNIEFRLANIPNGSGYHLILSKNNAVRRFIDLIKPYIEEIPSMKYKIDIDSKLRSTQESYLNQYPDRIVKVANKVTIDNSYSKEEEAQIIEMIRQGHSLKQISITIDRTYAGLYDKVQRMKNKGKF